MKKLDKRFAYSDIHFRDRWQFELKSDFFPHPSLEENIHTQEFYLFIPDALQVNEKSYSKEQFYQDQTNLIRYKTPAFTLIELLDSNKKMSPIYRLKLQKGINPTQENKDFVEDELKLLGNIVRSSLRTHTHLLANTLNSKDLELFITEARLFCKTVYQFRENFLQLKQDYLKEWNDVKTIKHFEYINDFICNSIELYVTGLLDLIREESELELRGIDQDLCELILSLTPHELEQPLKGYKENEYLLYQKSILNKYVLDALLLHVNRFSLRQRYQNIIGALAAGIAMLVYLLLFIWQGEIFLINSWPFVLITVIIYILKDRLKDGIKSLSYQWSFKWFPDYITEIRTPDGEHILGSLKETVSFSRSNEIPYEISTIRNKEFHEVLEAFKRPETVIHYKKTAAIRKPPTWKQLRRFMLNIIFRFNIEQFLKKASNPYDLYLRLDRKTQKLVTEKLPKVYHINIIMINSYHDENLEQKKEMKKYRLIIDKNGLNRVEQL